MRDSLHDGNASSMELVDGPLGWDTDGTNEQGCPSFDDDVNELWQLTRSVVFLEEAWVKLKASTPTRFLGLASIATNLREQKINTKRGILVFQTTLQLVNGTLKEHWALAKTANDANATWIVI